MPGNQSWKGRLDGSVYEIRSGPKRGQWCAQLDSGYTRAGKRKTARRFRKTEDEAWEALRDLNGQKDQGHVSTPKRDTVATFINRWHTDVVSAERENTQRAYAWATGYVIEHLGRIRMADIDTAEGVQQIQRMFTTLGKMLSPRSVRHIRTVFGTALNIAVKWDIIERNPVERTEPPKAPKKARRRLTLNQAVVLLEAAKGDRWEALYLLGIVTGMRIGEITGLKWADFHFEDGTDEGQVTISRRLEYRNSPWRLEEVKADGSEHTHWLPPIVVNTLKQHRQRQLEQRLKAGPAWEDHGFVFAVSTGGPVQPTNVTSRYLKAMLANDERQLDLPVTTIRIADC